MKLHIVGEQSETVFLVKTGTHIHFLKKYFSASKKTTLMLFARNVQYSPGRLFPNWSINELWVLFLNIFISEEIN